ncbi:MAG: queuosine precursor transporter [Archangium sp.]|nr:queuosine precursor transporter [Archangium sp.]
MPRAVFRLDTRATVFLSLAALFVSALLIGDIIGSKLFDVTFFGKTWTLSAGIIPFPMTFVLTDVLNEFYGKRAARTVTWVGFAMAVFAFTIITISVYLPWHAGTLDPEWKGVTQGSFDAVFRGGQRILLASMVAYLLSQFLDIWVFDLLKRTTSGRFIWLRATGSTLVSQLIDTAVIQTGVWVGIQTLPALLELIATSYLVKIGVAVGLTPVVYAAHAVVQRVLKLEPLKPGAEADAQPESSAAVTHPPRS